MPMAAGVPSAAQELGHSNSETQAEDPLAMICCKGQQTYSERRWVLRIGVFSQYTATVEIRTLVWTAVSGQKMRSQALPWSGQKV